MRKGLRTSPFPDVQVFGRPTGCSYACFQIDAVIDLRPVEEEASAELIVEINPSLRELRLPGDVPPEAHRTLWVSQNGALEKIRGAASFWGFVVIEELPALEHLQLDLHVEHSVYLSGLGKLRSLEGLHLTHVGRLSINDNDSLQRIGAHPDLVELRVFDIANNPNLESLGNFPSLRRLENLGLSEVSTTRTESLEDRALSAQNGGLLRGRADF